MVEQAAHRDVPGGDAPLRAGPASRRPPAALHAPGCRSAIAAVWLRSCRPTSAPAAGPPRDDRPGRLARAAGDQGRGRGQRPAAGDSRGPPLLQQRSRLRRACQGPQVAAHGVLLSRAAQASPRADGTRRAGRRARRRPVELRRRQPRVLRRGRPGRRAAAFVVRARCRHARGDRARQRPLRTPPGPAGQLRLAGHARAGAAVPAGLHQAAAAAVRSLSGRDVAGRSVAVSRAPVGRAQPETAEPARGGRCG